MRFEFSSSRRILFGEGVLELLLTAPELDHVKNVLLVRGKGGPDTARLEDILQNRHIRHIALEIKGEPCVNDIETGAALAREHQCDRVIGFGGGSAIDTAKAVAALAPNSGRLIDYLEVVGAGKALQFAPLGVIAVPTTAGTGSEVTRNAVILVPEHSVKVSLRSQGMLPWLAVVDPRLTYSLPPGITASTGMDALTQILEPFVSVRANPMSDEFCRAGLQRVGNSLISAFKDGLDARARENMSFVSLMGGLALANAGLGAVHGFAGPIGGRYNAPHGQICARLLPSVVKVNLKALRTREPAGIGLHRYEDAARMIFQSDKSSVDDLVEWISVMCEDLSIPSLLSMGMKSKDKDEIARQAAVASSMKANPILLHHEELLEILELAS